ncbi:MAG TPA: hypothetical protein VHX90_03040 [Verrucomicrobiae bacterium]|jgi:hypothetical protein|nr:hypothetical protein [Verrucomicrobiae bacterium]
MKFIFKWLFRLFILAVVLIIVFFLSLNSILRVVIEHNIRAQTGMDAEIGRFKLGILEPTIEIQSLKIYNSTNFAGAPFLDIPEIHVEYDRAALAHREIHITLMRFNLGELDIVKNQTGQTNIFALGLKLPPKNSGVSSNAVVNLKKQTGYDFKGIDVLNISIGKVKFIDLKDPQNNREQIIGLESVPVPNVKSPADLGGLAALIYLHSDGFFESLAGQKKSGLDVLKQLGL